jgi:hypothetical protein
MRVIPESACLSWSLEVIGVAVARDDGALSYECGAILVVGAVLEETVPMLGDGFRAMGMSGFGWILTIVVARSIVVSVS